jgi:hypothetical protein
MPAVHAVYFYTFSLYESGGLRRILLCVWLMLTRLLSGSGRWMIMWETFHAVSFLAVGLSFLQKWPAKGS